MDYKGEHLLPGQLGHFFVVLSLVASLIAAFSYFKSAQSRSDMDAAYWKKLGRIAFLTEVFSVFAVFSILFYIIYNHYFEYHYAWKHSSRSLEVKYLLSCFWEGQEGSFLLWSIWHCVLGMILIKTSKKWEAPVMSVISFAQFCIGMMLAGIYVWGEKLGSNPFVLLRETDVLAAAPMLHIDMNTALPLKADYLTHITDGNDLNPLLQNYWMVIHPPVLFMGFASTIVPFAFAVAGLWKKKFGEAMQPALPWALFSAAIFGVGIMMGAAWAYESLTFGGYWAWDPVENASLVPWMVLVAGIHTLLIYKHSGHSLRATYLFLLLSFAFVLYSTFLTRSGVLGETSVHAFNPDLSIYWHLIIFLVIFVVPSMILFATRYRQIPAIHKEENTSSREFWMFIGSLVFFLSAIVIIAKTSLPVFNKVFGTKLAAPEDEEFAYNQIQVFVAIIIALLTAITQYLRYKQTPWKAFWKKIAIPTIVAAVLATLLLVFGHLDYQKQGVMFMGAIWLAAACSVYAIVANIAYIWLGVRGALRLSGGSIAHFGFGLVLLGILLSSSKKELLSYNTSGIPIEAGKDSTWKSGENLTLVRDIPMKMGKFDVTYLGDSIHPKKQQWYFKVHFKSRTDKEEFTLMPDAFVNYKGNEALQANPSSKHYWDHDVFTYVSALPNPEKNKDTATFRNHFMKVGDTAFYSKGFLVLANLSTRDSLPFADFKPGDKGSVATIKVQSFNKSLYTSQPALFTQSGQTFMQPDTVMSESLVLRVNKVSDDGADIGVKESDALLQYVTLKAYKFPFINMLWLGVIITAIGIVISMVRRISVNRLSKAR